MSAKTAMLEAARSACLAALQAVEAAIESEDAAPQQPADPNDFSHLTFDDPPPSAAPPPPIRRKNGQR